MRFRVERDALGEKKVPAEAYYGIQSLRSKENSQITKRGLSRQMIKALAVIKKAAARANEDAGIIAPNVAEAISLSCDEIINGRLHGQFITDLIQGGAGTSMNMNANEVIANRANEMLGGEKGKYNFVHPIDHVNRSQSTNDVVPTAAKITTLRLTKKLIVDMKKIQNACLEKANEFKDIYKMGRTHLQDAVPMTFGQHFGALASMMERDIKRVEHAMNGLLEINMGATAIGSGLNTNPIYVTKVIQYICQFTGEDYYQSKDLFDSTRHLDPFLWLSSAIKTAAVNLSKAANDFRLMASGPNYGLSEVILPEMQPGSTIMPGKVNPVIPEVVNQTAFYVIGLDATITSAVEAGQLELNVFGPVIYASIVDMLNYFRRAVRVLREKVIEGIIVNQTISLKDKKTNSLLAVLIPYIGYELCTEIIQESEETNTPIKTLILSKTNLTEEEIAEIFDIEKMTTPHIDKNTKSKKIRKK